MVVSQSSSDCSTIGIHLPSTPALLKAQSNPPNACDRLLDHGLDVGGQRYVRLDEQSFAASFRISSTVRFAFRFASSSDHNLRSPLRKQQRSFASDARGSAVTRATLPAHSDIGISNFRNLDQMAVLRPGRPRGLSSAIGDSHPQRSCEATKIFESHSDR